MQKHFLIGQLFALALVVSSPAKAQYMYLDANGDGIWTAADSLNVPGTTRVDIWLSTNANKSGSSATCPYGQALTLNSYEVYLRAVDGTVAWGPFINNQTVMGVSLGMSSTPTAHRAGFAGGSALSAGTYKLGSVNVFVTSGRPRLEIAAQDSLGAYVTSFGSACDGVNGDNTMTLGQDWADVDGIASAAASVLTVQTFDGAPSIPGGWATSGTPVWRVGACNYFLGNYSAYGHGTTCCSYATGANNVLSLSTPAYVSEFESYQFSFVENHQIESGDVFSFAYLAGPSSSSLSNQGTTSLGSFDNTNGAWTRRTGAFISNIGQTNAYLKPVFGFESFVNSINDGWCKGAWIDSVQIYGVRRPDLIVTKASVSPKAGATKLVEGDSCTFRYTIRNLGDQPANGYDVRVWLHRTGADTTIGIYSQSVLAAGDSVTRIVDGVKISRAGTYELHLKADYSPAFPSGLVDESKADDTPENNNTYQAPTTYQWSDDRDLAITSFVVDKSVAAIGDSVVATVRVKNKGTDPCPSSVLGFYRNPPGAPTSSTPATNTANIPLLAAGDSAAAQFKIASNSAETCSFYVFADKGGLIVEANEVNNIAGPLHVTWAPKTIVVRGVFQYNDSVWGGGGITSTYCNDIELYDWDSTKVDLLGSVAAQWQTNVFEFPAILNKDDTPDHGLLDLFIQVNFRSNEHCWNLRFPINWLASVRHPDGALWQHKWPVAAACTTDVNPSNDTLNVGTLTPTSYGERAALHLLKTVCQRGWGFVRNITPDEVPFPELQIIFEPGHDEETGYLPDEVKIDINDSNDIDFHLPDTWDDAVILHEYAHYLTDVFGVSANPVGDHDFLTPSASKALAWNEGFADFFGGLRGNDPFTPGFGTFEDYGRGADGTVRSLNFRDFENDIERFYGKINLTTVDSSASALHRGPWVRGAVACALWDLYDSHDEPKGPTTFGDRVSDGFQSIWETLLTGVSSPLDVNWFESQYLLLKANQNTDYGHALAVRGVFLDRGIGNGSDSAVVTGVDLGASTERMLRVTRASPNPFNPNTKIKFLVRGTGGGPAVVRVFDVQGRHVRTLAVQRPHLGVNEVTWDGLQASGATAGSGVYFAEVEWAGLHDRTKLVMIR